MDGERKKNERKKMLTKLIKNRHKIRDGWMEGERDGFLLNKLMDK